ARGVGADAVRAEIGGARLAVVGAQRAVRGEEVRAAEIAHAVAHLGDVTRPGRRAAQRRALQIGGTRGTRPGAVLDQVALALRAATDERARAELVGRTGERGAVARLGGIAGAGRRATDLAPVARPSAVAHAALAGGPRRADD